MIETARLRLHPLSPSLVALLVERRWDAARATRPPFEITDQTFSDDAHVLALRHAQLTADPTEEPWLYRVAVLEGTRTGIGRVGFHAPPDADGMVEIGYRVLERFRRRGFAVEMAMALMSWAAAQGATHCLASVRPDNVASLGTIAKMGFTKVGEHIDEIDGLEWIHRRDLV